MVTPSFPYITTKLHIPTTRSSLIQRSRLSRQLNRCTQYKLLLITAPAGFGKTTLLSEWSQRSTHPVAWVSLDATDNDPIHFWSYVIAALDKLDTSVGKNVLPFVHSSRPAPTEYTVPTLVNTVANIPDHFALVLDDYHCIESEAIHGAVAYLLDYMPANMHLILASRIEPPLPLAQWRARGQLLELRAADLRFSSEETGQLLNQTMELSLRPKDVTTLQRRTEGWAAGLQLAALAVQEHGGHTAITSLQDFRGDHHYIVSYLASEVLQQQPEPTRDFLLQTAILDTLNGSLCDAITGQANGQAILEQLHQGNLFITALSHKGQYRYHQLFADFLRDQIQHAPSVDVPTLHLRAADWYERHGDLDRAIDHTLAAGCIEEATQLIEKAARPHMLRGEFATLSRWFKALPDWAIRDNAEFCLIYAWVLANRGQIKAAAQYLDHLDAQLADDMNVLLGEAATIRARIAVIQGDTAQNIHYSKKALDLLPSDTPMRSDVYLDLAFAYSGADFEAAESSFDEAINLSRATGNLRTALMATYYMACMYTDRGQFRRAVQSYQQALAWCQQADPTSAAACWAHAGFGALLYEWNDLTAAIDHLQRAVKLAKQGGEVKVLMYARVPLALALHSQGRSDEAMAILDTAAEVAQQTCIQQLATQIGITRMRISLDQGDVDTAGRWLQNQGINMWHENLSPKHVAALAWFHLAQSKTPPPAPADALSRVAELLEALCEGDATHDYPYLLVQHLTMLALVYQASGDQNQAVEKLARATAIAEPLELARTFIDCGTELAVLLREVASRERGSSYVAKLLAAFRDDLAAQRAPERPPRADDQPLIEPLGEREIEVLQHIARGHSNKEIADEMVVAVSTVKWYLRNIYGKLQVHRRTQAVARARELNLL